MRIKKRNKLEQWTGISSIMQSETGKEYFGRVVKSVPAIGFFECLVSEYFPRLGDKINKRRVKYRFVGKENARLLWIYSFREDKIHAFAHNSGFFWVKIRRLTEDDYQ